MVHDSLQVQNTVTLSDTWNEYHTRKRLKASTLNGYRKIMNCHFRDWLSMPIASITKRMIADRHAELSDRTPAMANLAMKLLRALFAFAGIHWDELRDLAVLNPVKILTAYGAWNPIQPRSRTIKSHQMPAWFAAVRGSRHSAISDYLLLVLLTGLRRDEAATLKWEDVDLIDASLVVQQTKSGKRHEIPICSQLLEILQRRRKQDAAATWVFPGRKEGAPMRRWEQPMQRVIATSGVDFVVHDLRRTFGTIAHALDVPHKTIQRLLNHSPADITSKHYIQPSLEPLREPVQRIADEIYRQAQLDRPANLPHWKWPQIPPHLMQAWFAEVRMHPSTIRDCLLVSLLLGLRRTDAPRLRWEDVDWTARTIVIRESKNGAGYELPLPDQVLAILKDRQIRGFAQTRWIFASDYHRGHISGVSVPQWDLRATFEAVAKERGIRPQEIRGMLGHAGRAKHGGKACFPGCEATKSVEALRIPMQRVADKCFAESGNCCAQALFGGCGCGCPDLNG